MVCLGNICRSPLAEGILQSKVNPEKVVVDSAGTGGYHVGNKPDSRSIAVAQKNGIDISLQRCRKFSKQDFLDFDIIYAMDKNNYTTLASLAESKEQLLKLRLLLDEVNLEYNEVPDPYYDDAGAFEDVFAMIDKACSAIARKYK